MHSISQSCTYTSLADLMSESAAHYTKLYMSEPCYVYQPKVTKLKMSEMNNTVNLMFEKYCTQPPSDIEHDI